MTETSLPEEVISDISKDGNQSSNMAPNPGPAAYASGARRFVALVIDKIILTIVCFPLGYLVGLLLGPYTRCGILFSAVYYVAFECSSMQATPGKKAMGIYLADTDGRRLSLLRALLRYSIYYAPYLPMLVYITSLESVDMMAQVRSHLNKPEALIEFMHSEAFQNWNRPLILQSFGGFLFSALAIWLPIVFTKQKTGLHDALTKVRVFRKKVI